MAKPGEHRIVPCVICDVSYRQSRSDQMYCNGKCASRAWRWKRQRMRICVICGDSFAPHGRQKYCGSNCAIEAEREQKRAKNNRKGKGWSKGMQFVPRRICEVCGCSFYAPPVLVRRGGGRFCSIRCYGTYVAMNPSRFPRTRNRRGIGGKRDDLGGLYLRSSWEANWARYLNWLMELGEIESWEYEPRTFEFQGIKKGTRFYTPDFSVVNKDGSLEYHEVKGYMDAKSKTKLKRMAKYYPDIKLILIEKDTYYDMANKVGPMIPNWEGRLKS